MFYASIKNIKRAKGEQTASLGSRIYTCDKKEGIQLMAAYASHIITNNF
jgi:hypothetical protein